MCNLGTEQAEVWTETTPKAKKRWACEECPDPILPGRHYSRIGVLYEGAWSTMRFHTDCLRLHQRIGSDHCGGEWQPGELKAALREHYRDDPGLLGAWAATRRARRIEQAA